MRSAGLLGGLLVCSACGPTMVPPIPEPPAASPPAQVQASEEIEICIVEQGQLRLVEASVHAATGDTLVAGRPFRQVFPNMEAYAAREPWFVTHEPITWQQRRYTKFGLPRILSPSQVRPGGQRGGITFFIEADAAEAPDLIFVPISPGCEFHPYQWDLTTGGVRGGA